MSDAEVPAGRPAPPLSDRSRPYWLSGAEGVLKLATCQACGFRLHPPKPICPRCRSRDIAFAPVSGRGRIHAWTINRYPWNPRLPPPYVIADVELEEQEGLLILSNIVDCPLEALRVGLPVQVAFEQAGEAFVPVFRP
jgi:uncharacterized OB-fold protein